MTKLISVVVPVYNAKVTLAECLNALTTQSLDNKLYEVIIVDDGSSDSSAEIASKFQVNFYQHPSNKGAPAARNTGLNAATGKWVAFTDADCIPSRSWLTKLLKSIDSKGKQSVLGAAGHTISFQSNTAAARYVDLMGGLDAIHHLSHPTFPFAPSGNIVYSREILNEEGGFDERYSAYDACDLYTRILRNHNGTFDYVADAIVLHRHRNNWMAYWQQQKLYGRGLAQFMLHYREIIQWPLLKEISAWAKVAKYAACATIPGNNDQAIKRKGHFLKSFAQRVGFVLTYWNTAERKRWLEKN